MPVVQSVGTSASASGRSGSTTFEPGFPCFDARARSASGVYGLFADADGTGATFVQLATIPSPPRRA
jgi:hypothetical protein